MTQTELGKALGLQQPAVSKLIKQGMPSDNIQAARDWRQRKIRNKLDGVRLHPNYPNYLGATKGFFTQYGNDK